MLRRPPRSTRTATPVPSTTLFRSAVHPLGGVGLDIDRVERRPAMVEPVAGAAPCRIAHQLDCPEERRRAPVHHARAIVTECGADEVAAIAEHGFRHASPNGNDDGMEEFRSEEHTYELQSLMRNPYAVFCLKK